MHAVVFDEQEVFDGVLKDHVTHVHRRDLLGAVVFDHAHGLEHGLCHQQRVIAVQGKVILSSSDSSVQTPFVRC